jgi:hypothetical protein
MAMIVTIAPSMIASPARSTGPSGSAAGVRASAGDGALVVVAGPWTEVR